MSFQYFRIDSEPESTQETARFGFGLEEKGKEEESGDQPFYFQKVGNYCGIKKSFLRGNHWLKGSADCFQKPKQMGTGANQVYLDKGHKTREKLIPFRFGTRADFLGKYENGEKVESQKRSSFLKEIGRKAKSQTNKKRNHHNDSIGGQKLPAKTQIGLLQREEGSKDVQNQREDQESIERNQNHRKEKRSSSEERKSFRINSGSRRPFSPLEKHAWLLPNSGAVKTLKNEENQKDFGKQHWISLGKKSKGADKKTQRNLVEETEPSFYREWDPESYQQRKFWFSEKNYPKPTTSPSKKTQWTLNGGKNQRQIGKEYGRESGMKEQKEKNVSLESLKLREFFKERIRIQNKSLGGKKNQRELGKSPAAQKDTSQILK